MVVSAYYIEHCRVQGRYGCKWFPALHVCAVCHQSPMSVHVCAYIIIIIIVHVLYLP